MCVRERERDILLVLHRIMPLEKLWDHNKKSKKKVKKYVSLFGSPGPGPDRGGDGGCNRTLKKVHERLESILMIQSFGWLTISGWAEHTVDRANRIYPNGNNFQNLNSCICPLLFFIFFPLKEPHLSF